jgi:SAM-dependent methyltransferase
MIVSLLQPSSVIDIGCGIGTWLAAFRENGVDDIIGVDGNYVDRSRLLIPETSFIPADISKPFSLERSFDLAVSLEVGEHLPRRTAPTFVKSLCSLAPLVLFSAAVPYQGGDHHVNEQWPSYWRGVFRPHDYTMLDPFRAGIWHDERVEGWYRQNLCLFAHESALESDERLRRSPVYSSHMTFIMEYTLNQHRGLNGLSYRTRVLRKRNPLLRKLRHGR